jgi:outer membrane protein
MNCKTADARWISSLLLLTVLNQLPSLAKTIETPLQTVTETTLHRPTSSTTLTLQDFLQQVRTNYPKLISLGLNRNISAAKLLEKQGAFDPQLSANTNFVEYNDTGKRGKQVESFASDAQLSIATPLGLKLYTEADYTRGKVKSPDSATGDDGAYSLGIKMPLLRGFIVNEKSTQLRQAKTGVPLADKTYRKETLDLLETAGRQYWDWVAASRRVQVLKDIVTLAQDRSTATKTRAEAGDIAMIETIEAQQEVARRQGQKTKGDREFQKENYKLALYLWKQGVPDALPTRESVPQNEARPILMDDAAWSDSREQALQKRPELEELALQRALVIQDKRLAKNQQLPAMDLAIVPQIDAGDRGIGPNMKAGVTIMIPLRTRTASGQIQQAELKLQKISLEAALTVQKIVTEVDDAVSALNTAYQRFLLAETEYFLAKQLQAGEQNKYEAGDSTLFLLNQRERSTAEAAIKVIDVHAEYEQARIALLAASGLL